MRRIGILGGTFNPPHIGHLIIASEVKYALRLDEVRLMPTSVPPHKRNPHDATPEQRLLMTELAVRHSEGIVAFPFEVERGGVSYTYETMKELTAAEPENCFFFIIGGDMIDSLPEWHKIDELCEIVTFVGVGRPGTIGESVYPVEKVAVPEIDLSSTFIRQRLSQKGPAHFLLPEGVEDFILREGLYGSRDH